MYQERELKESFEKVASVYPIVAIVGARQAGKTTFLKERMKTTSSTYLLFDDPDVRNLFEEDIKRFDKQFMEGKDVSILDEVQYCKDAGRNLKYLADTQKKLWITASSEIILGKKVLSYLVGRVSILKLYPFSLQEFLNFKQQKNADKKAVQRSIWEHIMFGGYPKVASVDDIELKKTILRDLYETMILKDVARTFSIEDVQSLEAFSRYLAINAGKLLSYEKIVTDIHISFQTTKKYLDALEKSYMLLRVTPFYTNKIKELTKQPKIFFVDTGIRNTLTKTFTEPDGALFENYVFSELLKLGFTPKYWRTKSKAEVDLVIEKNNELIAIEVKLTAKPTTIEKSLRSFIKTYAPKRAFVVFYNGDKGTITIEGCVVHFVDVIELKNALNKPEPHK